MYKKRPLVTLLCFFVLMAIPHAARAATITSATLDRNSYLAGQTGYISVTVYNDKSEKIRVTELSATINYYYTDGTVYLQKFFFPTDSLPDEITAGQSKSYQIPISLPTNIAAGYTNLLVESKTDLWRSQDERWTTSDHPTYPVKLYIESAYKQSYENSQQQLQEQMAVNENLTNTMNLLLGTTVVFASVAAFLMFFVFARRMKPTPQPSS